MTDKVCQDNSSVNNCSLGGICGGCFYVGETVSGQLEKKNNRVYELLKEATKEFDYEFEYQGIIESPLVFGYRNKMEYSFGDCIKGGQLTLGLHKKKSFYDVIDTDCCKLVHEDCNIIVRAAADYFRRSGVTYNDKKSHKGYLRYLIIRRAVNTGEMLIDLVTTSQRPVKVEKHADIYAKDLYLENGNLNPEYNAAFVDEHALIEDFKKLMTEVAANDSFEGKIMGILHTVDDALADAVRNDGTELLYGQEYITEELLGLKFNITPFSFFQTNSKGAEVLYSKVREFIIDELDKDMTVYDLYSGTGTIAQILAPCVKHVTGVEIIEEAVEAAKINAAKNGLDNCDFIADDVLKALDTLPAPDMIVIDPPRDGVNPKALKKLIDYGEEYMLYVSCKPESLARDLIMLQSSGYRIVKSVAVDQFPWTNNVETVCLLRKVLA
ncbi:MAG: methyltransferase domain-containing protein [Lachnospiraceae bacterium]|nr:methyltransferase domain-containing protein [Lachnospiraceae bacterium]